VSGIEPLLVRDVWRIGLTKDAIAEGPDDGGTVAPAAHRSAT
jgi:hypothetical protein